MFAYLVVYLFGFRFSLLVDGFKVNVDATRLPVWEESEDVDFYTPAPHFVKDEPDAADLERTWDWKPFAETGGEAQFLAEVAAESRFDVDEFFRLTPEEVAAQAAAAVADCRAAQARIYVEILNWHIAVEEEERQLW